MPEFLKIQSCNLGCWSSQCILHEFGQQIGTSIFISQMHVVRQKPEGWKFQTNRSTLNKTQQTQVQKLSQNISKHRSDKKPSGHTFRNRIVHSDHESIHRSSGSSWTCSTRRSFVGPFIFALKPLFGTKQTCPANPQHSLKGTPADLLASKKPFGNSLFACRFVRIRTTGTAIFSKNCTARLHCP